MDCLRGLDPGGAEVIRAARKLWKRFRSAVTGRFVSKDYAEANPETTVSETERR